jgi:hypothetical protein
MKIFISWSGNTSKEISEIFKQWLPGVIQAIKPYFSPDDISKGSRWNNEISKELEDTKIGIICLTKDNLEAPWIMFEAGALSKNIDNSKVCPILFGIEPTDIQGHLIQFQASKFSKNEIKKIIKMMNPELGQDALSNDVLNEVYEMWWPKLEEKILSILQNKKPNKEIIRSERQILEEVLTLTRRLSIISEQNNSNSLPSTPIFKLLYTYNEIVNEVIKCGYTQTLIDSLLKLKHPIGYFIDHCEVSAIEIQNIRGLFGQISSKLKGIKTGIKELELKSDVEVKRN